MTSHSDASRVLLWLSRILSLLILGLGIYAAATSIVTVCRHHTLGLIADQWDLVEKMMRTGGHLSFAELWGQHNEHRVPMAWLFGLLDLRIFGGRNISLYIEIFLVQTAAALVLIATVRKFARERLPLLTVIGLGLVCLFSPLEMENFIWGFQVTFVLAVFGAVAAFAAALWHSTVATDDRWISTPLLLSLLAALLAEFALAAGLVVWPMLIWLGFVLRIPGKSQLLTVAVAVLAIGGYFIGYERPPYHADPLQSIWQPSMIVKYVVTYFAYSWDNSLPSDSPLPGVSEVVTGSALVFSIAVAAWFSLRGSAATRLRCFLSANMLLALATGLITSLGRLNFGIHQATSSRYQAFSLLFWISLAILLLTWASASSLARAAVQLGILAFILATGRQYGAMKDLAEAQQSTVAEGYAALADPQADPEELKAIYPKPTVAAWYGYLRAHKLGADAREVVGQDSGR